MGKKDVYSEKKPRLQSKAQVDESVKVALDMLDALSPDEILQINSNLQRSQAEMAEELWDMKWKFQALFEQNSFSIVYHEMIYDVAGTPIDARYLDANKTFMELIGTDPRGKTMLQIFPECKTEVVHWMNSINQTFETIRFEQRWPLDGLWYECIAHQFKQGHFVMAILDITDRKLAEKKLRSSQARYQALVDQSVEALALVDIQTQEVVEVNRRFIELLGYSLPEDAPLFVSEFVITPKIKLDRFYNETLRQTSILPAKSMCLRHKNGTEVPVIRTGRVIQIDEKDYLLATNLDVTEELRHQKEVITTLEELRNKQDLLESNNALLLESQRILQYQATHDPLTDLSTRSVALEFLSKELVRNKRHGEGLAIGMCDIDHFKAINDTYGYQIGDEVLCCFAKTLTECVREYDVVARMGGEEFLLILPLKRGVDAKSVFERCCRQFSNGKIKTTVGEILLTISIGVAYATANSTMNTLLSEADDALYQAKAQGRNRVVYAMKI